MNVRLDTYRARMAWWSLHGLVFLVASTVVLAAALLGAYVALWRPVIGAVAAGVVTGLLTFECMAFILHPVHRLFMDRYALQRAVEQDAPMLTEHTECFDASAEPLYWQGNRRSDGTVVKWDLAGAWMILPPDDRPAITECPCCGRALRTRRSAMLAADAITNIGQGLVQ